MTRPRLLDLFCGAGGCTKGYQRAGFYVVGVDVEAQPNYCGDEFIQGDAISVLDAIPKAIRNGQWLGSFDAIHASPPCQAYSRNMKHLSGPQPMLIDATKERLMAVGVPWIIENVEGSPLPDQDDLFGRFGVILCGTMFGLRVWRHRWFESSFALSVPRTCNHSRPAMNPHNVAGRNRIYAEFGRQDPEILWRNEMGVDWMGRYEAREAIPPAYTEWLGAGLLATVEGKVA